MGHGFEVFSLRHRFIQHGAGGKVTVPIFLIENPFQDDEIMDDKIIELQHYFVIKTLYPISLNTWTSRIREMKTRIIISLIVIGGMMAFSACNNSPKVEQKQPVEQTTKVEYNCRMHPDYITDKPGTCPNCGMGLQVRDDKIKK
jgi:hypothetical protein